MHVFNYTKAKAGMAERTEDQLKSMMRDVKVSNRNFYLLKEKKVRDTQEKIFKMLEKIAVNKSNPVIWEKTVADCTKKYELYKSEFTVSRTWFHIDMDMFFAACELRDKPELKDKPIAVGDYSMI